MTISEDNVYIERFHFSVTRLTARLSFEDYKKIFMFMRWRVPVSFGIFGNPYVEGVRGYCANGEEIDIRLIKIRDILDSNWKDLKPMLQEEGQPDLGKYSEKIGKRETLSLSCGEIIFQTGQATCCSFDRIWGRLMFR